MNKEEVMKNWFLVIGFCSLLAACGPAAVLNSGCAGDGRLLCDPIFGHEESETEEQDIDAEFSLLQTQLDELYVLINNLQTANTNYTNLINNLQVQINNLLTRIVALEAAVPTGSIELIDPCGDKSGALDEVILKLPTGELIAYFESHHSSAADRFLTVLLDGNYQTTDSQECDFTVSNGAVTW